MAAEARSHTFEDAWYRMPTAADGLLQNGS